MARWRAVLFCRPAQRSTPLLASLAQRRLSHAAVHGARDCRWFHNFSDWKNSYIEKRAAFRARRASAGSSSNARWDGTMQRDTALPSALISCRSTRFQWVSHCGKDLIRPQQNDFARRSALSYGFEDGLHIGLRRLIKTDDWFWTDKSVDNFTRFFSGKSLGESVRAVRSQAIRTLSVATAPLCSHRAWDAG